MAKGYQLLVMAQVLLIELHQVHWLFLKFSKGLSFVLVCGVYHGTITKTRNLVTMAEKCHDDTFL